MNWATITPESRLYKSKSLFKWEDTPGLEHHCGTCATPLCSGRAKTSCIGKHVEPCYRFHQQLHFVGKSHDCFGCNTSDEMHHNRHKDILKVVRKISAISQTSSMLPSMETVGEYKGCRSSTSVGSIATSTDKNYDNTGRPASRLTRREKKRSKKTGNTTLKDKHRVESFTNEELDFVSSAIHSRVLESKGAWEGTYIYGHGHREYEEGAVVNNAAINEHENRHIDKKSDASSVKSRRRTIKKTTTPNNYKNFRGGSRKFSMHSASKRGPYDGLDPGIFFRLGIEVVNPPRNSKTRKDLVAKLIRAIKEDLEIIGREEEECALREEGFWRWAGKSAYHTMLQTRQEVDWATGQKKSGTRGESSINLGELAAVEDPEAEAEPM